MNQNGRSMIEILGVLAIVGILSVSGIAGYSKAMYKYKMMKLADDFNLFINNILPYKEGLVRVRKQKGDKVLQINAFLENAKLVPQTWTIGEWGIYDDFGGQIKMYVRDGSNTLCLDYYLKTHKKAKVNILNCQNLFTNIILQQKDIINNIRIWGEQESEDGSVSSGTKYQYYGTQYCNQNRNCLSNITMKEIINFCNDCYEEKICIFVMEY